MPQKVGVENSILKAARQLAEINGELRPSDFVRILQSPEFRECWQLIAAVCREEGREDLVQKLAARLLARAASSTPPREAAAQAA